MKAESGLYTPALANYLINKWRKQQSTVQRGARKYCFHLTFYNFFGVVLANQGVQASHAETPWSHKGLAHRVYSCNPMSSRLEEIAASMRLEVSSRKVTQDRAALEQRAADHTPRGFRNALLRASGTAVIAELKKASPSRGLIRADFPVAELAAELEHAGAAALSVLTSEQYFQGSLHNLEVASAATRLPCLRKDFIVDDIQLLEARAYGADVVLLIVAALSASELSALGAAARAMDLEVLCEVHDAMELERANDSGFDLIGVNNRNLHTFQVDLNTAFQLAELIPPGVTKVAESGIETGEDLSRLRQAGYDAFLVGESLMRAASPGNALRELLAQAVVAR